MGAGGAPKGGGQLDAAQVYTKADESKLKELNLQLEKMVAAVQTKRVELETEVTDTQSKQEKAKNEQENAGFCAVILCWGCVFHVCG